MKIREVKAALYHKAQLKVQLLELSVQRGQPPI